MRAPQLRGNATIIPRRKPLPLTSISPRTDTWWGFVEQWIAGTQAMLEIVTFVECAVGPAGREFVELPPVDLVEGDLDGAPPAGAPPPPGATVPPGDAAEPRGGLASVKPTKQHASIAVFAGLEVDRLWTSALATNYPFCASGGLASARLVASESPEAGGAARTLDISGYGLLNRRQTEKLRRSCRLRRRARDPPQPLPCPQRNPSAEGSGASGLCGRPCGGSGKL